MNRVVSLPSFKSRLITLLCVWKELQELRFWYRSYNDKQYFLLYFSAYSPFTLLIWYMVYKLWNDLILFFVCTIHSSITARFLSGPSLDVLGIAIAEIISKLNQNVCTYIVCPVRKELFEKAIVSGKLLQSYQETHCQKIVAIGEVCPLSLWLWNITSEVQKKGKNWAVESVGEGNKISCIGLINKSQTNYLGFEAWGCFPYHLLHQTVYKILQYLNLKSDGS